MTESDNKAMPYQEDVELSGHIIDSLILPKVLDEITSLGGQFQIQNVQIGHMRTDRSHAHLQVSANSEVHLNEILTAIGQHGAVPVLQHDCNLVEADLAGAFPEGFYATTNQKTEIRINREWIGVTRQEMDCGIRVAADLKAASCVPMSDVQNGELYVVGHQGTRVTPLERQTSGTDVFSFMSSTVSSEKPKNITVREIAAAMKEARSGNGKILVVAGPAVVHTGSRDLLSELIRQGFVDLLFAGNALAAHDIEQSWFGTSLGVSLDHGGSIDEGHEHHLRSINRVRRIGGIKQAVDSGVLQSGVMYECVRNNVPYLLAGSIRDDGPLPDVITDVLDAQRKMRELCQGVSVALMIATTLHSIAVGNLLPAEVKVVCVDINPATVTKLSDRGTFQTVGLVTDVEPFLRVLLQEINLSKTG